MFKLFRKRTGPRRKLRSGPFRAFYAPLYSREYPGGTNMYLLFHKRFPAPIAQLLPAGRIVTTAAAAEVKMDGYEAMKLETLFTRVHRELFRLQDEKAKTGK